VQEITYFIYNPQLYQILELLPERTLNPALSNELKDSLSAFKSNVKKMESEDLICILGGRKFDKESETYRKFLEAFWSAVNQGLPYVKNALYRLAVYVVTCQTQISVISPEKFDTEPVILEPSPNTVWYSVCEKFPGLQMVRQSTFPRNLMALEAIESKDGLIRFTRALSKKDIIYKTQKFDPEQVNQ
jgi:hypothetical protein